MISLLKDLPKAWIQVQQQASGQFVIIEPYAELNTTFRLELVSTEGYTLHIVRGLAQERWRVRRVTKNTSTEEITLDLQSLSDSSQTSLRYQKLQTPTQIPLGKWEEENKTIGFKSPFFVPAGFTAKLEKRYAPAPADSLAIGSSGRQGAWSRWRGPMDGDRKLTAFLCLQDSALEPHFLKGSYYYGKVWKDLTLRPAEENDSLPTGNWDLREFIGRERKVWTGKFIGKMDYRLRFEGEWQDPEATTKLKFSLDEDLLPFVLEDHLLWRKTSNTRRLDTLYYPKLTALESDTILYAFNDSLVKAQTQLWKQVSETSLTPVLGDYALLYANEHLLSLTFSIYRKDHKPEVQTLNFDWQEGKVLTLEDAYRSDDPKFEERIVALAQTLLKNQQPAPQKLPNALEALQDVNFLSKNLRILYFDPVSYYYYTIYIPYEKLSSFEKNDFSATKGLRDNLKF